MENFGIIHMEDSNYLSEIEAYNLAKRLFDGVINASKDVVLSEEINFIGFGYHAKKNDTGKWSIFITEEYLN